MSSPPANGYDADLLNSVKADKRADSGYSTDLLNDKPVRASTAPHPSTSASQHHRQLALSRAQRCRGTGTLKPRKARLYRTKKGLIIIGAVLGTIIVAAVVGSVVGSRNGQNNGQDIGQASSLG
ncbi:hypothetical protein BKA70DRAFT_1574158, partial [Coprinopsis sp. MPI-PUGE-AT-0042]